MMVIAVLSIEIYIQMANSLKDKRRIIKSIEKKCRNKYNVSISEVDRQELWKNTTIGIVTIGTDHRHLEKTLNRILKFIEGFYDITITSFSIDFY